MRFSGGRMNGRQGVLSIVFFRFVVLRLTRILEPDDFHHFGAHLGVHRFFGCLREGFLSF
jgi:hypothetical protein